MIDKKPLGEMLSPTNGFYAPRIFVKVKGYAFSVDPKLSKLLKRINR